MHSARASNLQRQALPQSNELVRDDTTSFVACEKFGVNSMLDTFGKHLPSTSTAAKAKKFFPSCLDMMKRRQETSSSLRVSMSLLRRLYIIPIISVEAIAVESQNEVMLRSSMW